MSRGSSEAPTRPPSADVGAEQDAQPVFRALVRREITDALRAEVLPLLRRQAAETEQMMGMLRTVRQELCSRLSSSDDRHADSERRIDHLEEERRGLNGHPVPS